MNRLKIEIRKEFFDLADVFRIARGSRTRVEVITVLISRDGIIGRGECVPYARYEESSARVIKQIETLPSFFDRVSLQELLPAGAARNAVDCALWDLEAKTCRRRVWELAGLNKPKPVLTAFTLSLDSPARMKAAAARHAHFSLLKIKLGTPDDMPRLEAVRKGAPNSRIIIDANEGWTVDLYRELSPHLLRLEVSMVEQPLPADNDHMLQEIKRPLPVCADESCHDRHSLTELAGRYDVINIKLDKTGGLTEALALREAARSEGFEIMIGCMVGSSLAMAPAVFLAQEASIADLDGPLLLAEDRDIPVKYEGNVIHPAPPELWG